jgi:hypothetical protein
LGGQDSSDPMAVPFEHATAHGDVPQETATAPQATRAPELPRQSRDF